MKVKDGPDHTHDDETVMDGAPGRTYVMTLFALAPWMVC